MDNKETLLKQAVEFNETKKWSECDSLLTDEILKQYNDVDLYAEKAEALYRLKKSSDCERIANIGFQLSPNNAKLNYILGNLYVFRKDDEKQKAELFYNKAIEIDKNYPNPYNGLGTFYHVNGDFDKAEIFYKKAIKLNPKYAAVYGNLGVLFFDKKDFQTAEEFYSKAIALDPEPSLFDNLGNVYYEKNEYEKAENVYNKAIHLNPEFSNPYYNLGLVKFNTKEYEKSLENFQKYIEVENDSSDLFSERAKAKIEEIESILASPSYEKISNLIIEIKNLLLFSGQCITHYTGISTIQILVLKQSPMRLSEGSFLNDPSEGEELFNFLEYSVITHKATNEKPFTKQPFIGSFVDSEKKNDLTLWRMYGKEALEEAKGCSITIDAPELKKQIHNKINPKGVTSSKSVDDIEFYRVAYHYDSMFEFAGADDETNEKLTGLMNELKDEIKKADERKIKKTKIIELLNTIAYLFKSIQYKYENEIRLVIKEAFGFERMIDFEELSFKPSITPNKVYIELVPILPLIETITIGPKVNRAEEWASTFHYHLLNNKFTPKINISKLPFK